MRSSCLSGIRQLHCVPPRRRVRNVEPLRNVSNGDPTLFGQQAEDGAVTFCGEHELRRYGESRESEAAVMQRRVFCTPAVMLRDGPERETM